MLDRLYDGLRFRIEGSPYWNPTEFTIHWSQVEWRVFWQNLDGSRRSVGYGNGEYLLSMLRNGGDGGPERWVVLSDPIDTLIDEVDP